MNRIGVSTLCALVMICASAPASGQAPTEKRRGPSPYSTPELTKRRANHAPVAAESWTTPRAGSLRGTLQFDNGAPLDDFQNPASQLSEMPPDPDFAFIAAAADDFIFVDGLDPLGSVQITNVRVAFNFFGDGGETATPTTTWGSVFVTVYNNDPSGPTGDQPAGEPDNMGGQIGSVAGSREVAASSLTNETPGGVCLPHYQVDIPLSVPIVLQKNVRYWLSVVPRFPAPPQSGWCYSQINQDNIAKNGFVTDVALIPFWTDVPGNFEEESCPDPPPAGTLRNLAFVLDAEGAATNPGACCDTAFSTCEVVPNPSDCTGEFDVFTPGATCGEVTCAAPANDDCVDAIVVPGAVTAFSTLGATTDGPPEACSTIDNDIWFKYTATCDGTLTINLCSANYDSALVVYDGCACPPGLGATLACNDDECGTASYVTFAVTSLNCYLIRIGGTSGATGTGQMEVTCTPTGFGACCHIDQSCTPAVPPENCVADGDVYWPGEPCSVVTCPQIGACCLPDNTCQIMTQSDCATATGVYQGDATTCTPDPCPPVGPDCCLGDVNNNCVVNDEDVELFVEVLLNPPAPDTPEFCRADVNQDDAVDGLDMAPFLEILLHSPLCESANCPPPNDACANAIVVTTSVTPFDTGLATTDGPSEACSTIDNDIWFEYTATCTGALTVSLCSSTNYDSALAIYDGTLCPPGPALQCDDNTCGAASQVSISATMDTVYLIRVGGTAGASGTGQMTISCIPTGSGACCHANQSCDVLPQVDCNAVDDVYTEGEPCSPLTCPPIGACCVPATPCQLLTEADCTLMSGTYQGDATTCTPDPCPTLGACCLAGPSCQETTATECSGLSGIFQGDGTVCTPNPCGPTEPECCVGDMNIDCTVDYMDVELFVDAVLEPPLKNTLAFCSADVNLDGTIDGLDVAPFVDKYMTPLPSCEQTCCPGDINGDGQLDGLDVQGLVDVYMSPSPPACGSAALCRADVDSDGAIDLVVDVEAFVNLLMTDAVCP